MAKNLVWLLSVVAFVGTVSGEQLEWWQSDIIYQIYPLSFKDSDGDGYGDINGITDNLDYLHDLGVGAVCLSSILESPNVDLDSEVTNFRDIDPVLGTLEDFDRLINKSNELGIKVILDLIPNHSSDEHSWFQKSVLREDPYTDYYTWADGRPEREKRAVTFNYTDDVTTESSSHGKKHNGNTKSLLNKDHLDKNRAVIAQKNITTNSSQNTNSTGTNSTSSENIQLTREPNPDVITGTNSTNPENIQLTREPNPDVTTSSMISTNSTSTTLSPISTTLTTDTVSNSTTVNRPTMKPHLSMNNTALNKTTVNSTEENHLPSKRQQMLPPNNWVSITGGSAWQWHEKRGQFYLHQSTASRPDLNYRNPQLVEEMKDILMYWLDKGVHGFRLVDVPLLFENKSLVNEPLGNYSRAQEIPFNLTGYWNISHIHTIDQPETYDMVAQWRQLLDNYNSNITDGISRILIIVGLVTRRDSLLYYGSSAAPGAHLVMSCNFVCEPKVWKSSFVDLSIRWWEDSTPAKNQIAWMAGNEDVMRVASRLSPELVDIVNTLLLLLPGVPFTYYGEEIGMNDTNISWEQTQDMKGYPVSPNNYHYLSRDPARTPFQWNNSTSAGFSTNETTWLPVNSNYNMINQKTQSQVAHSHFQVYTALARLRRQSPVQRGDYNPHVFSAYAFGFSRTLTGYDTVVAVFNLGSLVETVNLLRIKGTQQQMCVYTYTSNAQFPEREYVQVENLVLPPLSAVVFTENCNTVTAGAGCLVSGLHSVLLLLLCVTAAIFHGLE